jgi:octaprenyl-diphosphate synthase
VAFTSVKNFKEITRNINADLDYFENLLAELAGNEKDLLKEILDYIFETKGKRVRPVLVYLTARLFSSPNSTTHDAALLVELMHTATLLHDDVVDKALLRRGKQTVNHKWDDKTAVLSGDFLFAKAMKLATDHKEYKLFDIITPAIISLSVGELQQMSNSAQFIIDEDKYLDVIKKKTASLLSVCCKAGVYSTNDSLEDIEKAGQFGEILGIIFQIKDDILDYVGSGETGKETGIDIREGKVTLPLIRAWEMMSEEEKNSLSEYWSCAGNLRDCENKILKMVISRGGIKAAEKDMIEYKKRALKILNEFPKSVARDALSEIIDYIIERDK